MIARVRVAPVEQWCDWVKAKLPLRPKTAEWAGLYVEIDTESMYLADGHKHWDVTPECYQRIGRIADFPADELEDYEVVALCEHMLEMD